MTIFKIRNWAIFATALCFICSQSFTSHLSAQQTRDLLPKGEWDAGTTYAKDDIVTARGSSWLSLHSNNLNKMPGQTQPSTAIYWQLFARGLNPTGPWSNSIKYQPDDLVLFQAQTYRAKITNLHKHPSSPIYWELLAAKGAVGATGATGAQGPQGPAGPNTGVSQGTQSAPAISFSGDSGTGIFSPSAGLIALAQGGQLFLHSIGTGNTALGGQALKTNITGNNNTAVGLQALQVNSSGSLNTAVGTIALASNNSGGSNTAIGGGSLQSNSTGSNNTAIGALALSANTTGINNTAIGQGAIQANITGAYNAAVGKAALQANTTGNNNVAVGYAALNANTTGSYNTAIGEDVLATNTTGGTNVAIGSGALFSNTTGSQNTVVGAAALGGNTTGSLNAVLGRQALQANTTGNANVAIGYLAGWQATSPISSIFILNPGSGADSNTIKIGTHGIQTSTFIAGIAGKTVSNSAAVLVDSTTGQLGTVSSSRRYKEDINAMDDPHTLLMGLRPVTFRYKEPLIDGSKPIQHGLIAEDVADTLPYLTVFNGKGQPETVKYHELPTFLLAGYQVQQKTIERHANEITELKRRLSVLEQVLLRKAGPSH